MTAIVTATDAGYHDLTVAIALGRGAIHERPAEAGVAHLAEHVMGARLRAAAAQWMEASADRFAIIEAFSYTSHTELCLRITAAGAAEAIAGFRDIAKPEHLWAAPTEIELARESAVISREVALRRRFGTTSTWPWAFMWNIVHGGTVAHDSFAAPRVTDSCSTVAAVRDWLAVMSSGATAVAISAPSGWTLDVQDLARRVREGLLADPATDSGRKADLPTPPVVVRPQWLSRTPGSAPATPPGSQAGSLTVSFVDMESAGQLSRLRGRLTLLRNLIADSSPASGVQPGPFGAYYGADFTYVFQPAARSPRERLSRKISWPQLPTHRKRAVGALDQLMADQAWRTRSLARDTLFNLDLAQTRADLSTVTLEQLIATAGLVDSSAQAHIIPTFSDTQGALQWVSAS